MTKQEFTLKNNYDWIPHIHKELIQYSSEYINYFKQLYNMTDDSWQECCIAYMSNDFKTEYICFKHHDDFWEKWNQFKKVYIFI